jgi:hypothetical protein
MKFPIFFFLDFRNFRGVSCSRILKMLSALSHS